MSIVLWAQHGNTHCWSEKVTLQSNPGDWDCVTMKLWVWRINREINYKEKKKVDLASRLEREAVVLKSKYSKWAHINMIDYTLNQLSKPVGSLSSPLIKNTS